MIILEEEGKKEAESLFKEILSKNFPNIGEEQDIQIHKANLALYYVSTKRPSPRYITLKLSKVSNINLKSCQCKRTVINKGTLRLSADFSTEAL